MMKTFLTKTLMTKSKLPPKLLSMQKWYEPWKNSKLCIMMMPTKSSSKQHKRKVPSKLKNFLIDLDMVTTDTKHVPEEPKTFTEAWSHTNRNSQVKWQKVIKKDLLIWTSNRYDARQVKILCPPNHRCVKNKWVFKIKHNIVYYCMQIQSGTWHWFFRELFSGSEWHNFCLLLLMVIHFSYLAKIVDIETAFLYGDLEEEIYMGCHQGMSNIKEDDCIILNKCIYGLVLPAWQHYKKAVKILKRSGFVRNSIDPCLYVKRAWRA